MKPARVLPIALLALAFLARSTEAFAFHSRALRSLVRTPPSQTSIKRTQDFCSGVTPSLRLDKNDKNNDVEGKYTTVEDGSPLGVAIVLLGGLFIFGSGDESFQDPTSDSVWIVFVTASTAAGLARLFRYYTRGKNE